VTGLGPRGKSIDVIVIITPADRSVRVALDA